MQEEAFPPHHPNVILPDAAMYTRSGGGQGGVVLGIQEATSSTWDARQLPLDPSVHSEVAAADADQAEALLADRCRTISRQPMTMRVGACARYEELACYLPALEYTELRSYHAGMSTYTPVRVFTTLHH